MNSNLTWPITGHKRIIHILENQIKKDTLSHAYLFLGPSSLGKFTLAKIFSQTLLCLSDGDKKLPCGECSSCQSFLKNIHPDFILVKNTDGLVSIEAIRELKRQISFLPTLSKRKIVIFEEACYLTPEAQNALLKTLEEPPKYLILILVAQRENLLPTILSRCTILNFQPISHEEIEKELLKSGASSEKANFLACLSLGQIGRVLKDSSFLENWEKNLDFLIELSSSDLKTKMDFAKKHAESGQLKDLISWFSILRDVLFLKIKPSLLSHYPPFYLKKLSQLSNIYKTEQIFNLLKKLQKTEELSLTNINQRLLLEDFVLAL